MGLYCSANTDTRLLPVIPDAPRRRDPRIRRWSAAITAGATVWAAIIIAFALATH